MRLGSIAAAFGVLFAAAFFLTAAPVAVASDSCGGKNESAYLGIRMQRIDGGLAEALDVEDDSGVLVSQVLDESPAREAGLEAGDIIVELAGKKAGTPEKLRKILERRSPGDEIEVHYLRDGDRESTQVTLGERHKIGKRIHKKLGKLKEHALDRERGFLGVHTQSLSGDLGDYFGVEGGEGALVTKVVEDSPAAKLGLKPGDVITEVGGESIKSPSDLRHAIREYTEATEVNVVWTRDGKQQDGTTTLELREAPLSALGHAFWGDHGFLPHLRLFDIDVEDSDIELDEEDWDELSDELERSGRRHERRLMIRHDLEDAVKELSEEITELREELQKIKEDLAAD